MRVLGSVDTRHELHAAAGEQRGVAEDAASLDGVDRGAVGARLQCHLTVADHPDVVGYPRRIVGDHRPRGKVDRLRAGCQIGEFIIGHPLERRVLAQERH